MDLSKLSPAPWRAEEHGPEQCGLVVGDGLGIFGAMKEYDSKTEQEWQNILADVKFCALARNAFDVMMRRGWSAVKYGSQPGQTPGEQWYVDVPGRLAVPAQPDPFTALVEADKWYRENVEKP